MISFLEGKIEYTDEKSVIISTGSIGYRVIVGPKLLNILTKNQARVKSEQLLTRSADPALNPPLIGGQRGNLVRGQAQDATIKLYIFSKLNMREGTFDLYGFDKTGDLDLFNILTSVSGIGPKNAMAIMDSVEPKHLKQAVANEDANYLRKVSGLGPKTAQRLILELKNKLDFLQVPGEKNADLEQRGNALDALVALGYSQSQALKALDEISDKTKGLQEQVREALRILSKR